MYTRSRTGPQHNFVTGRGSMNPSHTTSNNTYNQQPNYQVNTTPRPGGLQQQQQQQQQQSPQPQRQQQTPGQAKQMQQQATKQQLIQQQAAAQLKQQQQNQMLQQQNVSSALSNQGLNQTSSQSIPQSARLKPILKQSALASQTSTTPASPVSNAPAVNPLVTANNPMVLSMPSSEESGEQDFEMKVESDDQPRWKRIKVPGAKVNRKLKRLRMNQRLRKTLVPKNAIMVLNEMKAGVKLTLVENTSLPNSMFLVHAELEGKIYVGQGLSKPLARQNAAENALKGLLLEKMFAASKKMIRSDEDGDIIMNTVTNTNVANTTNITINTNINMDNVLNTSNEGSEADGTSTPMEMSSEVEETDDIPWGSLASFALYKLFLEWQNQGTVVPMPRPGVHQSSKNKSETRSPPEKKLPPNATTIHPVMLLNQMRPGSTYVEVNRRGNPPNTIFTLSVDIDGQSYCGEAKNKKDAKKMAAKNALKALFDLDYPPETQSIQMETANIQPPPSVFQLS